MKIVATRSDGYMAIIDVKSGKQAIKFDKKEFRHETDDNMAIWQARFSLDGKSIVTASEDGEVALWDLNGNKLKTLRLSSPEGKPGADTVSYSREDRFVVARMSDGMARVYSEGKAGYRKVMFYADQVTLFSGADGGQVFARGLFRRKIVPHPVICLWSAARALCSQRLKKGARFRGLLILFADPFCATASPR